jgi:hypothetical protein
LKKANKFKSIGFFFQSRIISNSDFLSKIGVNEKDKISLLFSFVLFLIFINSTVL